MRFWIDECVVVDGKILDRGFVLDTDAEIVEWTEPIQKGKTYTFPIDKCTYSNIEHTPVSVEDGELVGVPEEEYFAQFRGGFEKIMTAAEADRKWGLGRGTVRKACNENRFVETEARKSGGTWLVTCAGMERLYGPRSEGK